MDDMISVIGSDFTRRQKPLPNQFPARCDGNTKQGKRFRRRQARQDLRNGRLGFNRVHVNRIEPIHTGHSQHILKAARRGARLLNAIREGLDQPGPLTRRMHRLLLELRALLLLENAHGDDWDDTACFATLDPEHPIVDELCLLADGFDEALRGAGVLSMSDEGVA
ncbi:hypothetical protein [Pseudosulfitobacter koreensis]|uniref:Uncharacterized protein n=1 Tax=Pseudosulfitobacter koreensis TaxID=2968472 RepID=A0ABT1Z435_9RHOB|nr:hypothetical protein [Pseudosulfitobacter koreense]MCR8827886.1 hypothetical protein [Pseudosulfitobacter koreense]